MIALDTNIIVRFLVRDDEKQARQVYRRFRIAEDRHELLSIPLLVVLETIWVLDSVYEVARGEIIDAIEELMLMPILKFQNYRVLQNFLTAARRENTDLPDLLIAHSSRDIGCEYILTLDKKASRSPLFHLLK